MAKYEVLLKQHSPMIHFQANQYKATIRASEFKPKLDKFLIENFNEKKIEYNDFILRQATENDLRCALDYKVKIYLDNNCEGTVIKNFPNFFADTGKDNKGKYKYINCDEVHLEIFSLNKSLIDCISKLMPKFLQNENFGMRQSKGFGSFYINEEKKYHINGNEEKYSDDEWNFNKDWYLFEVFYLDDKKIFENIELFYKTLRSGINLYNESENIFYFKSLVARYIQDNFENIEWDKAAIKNNFNNGVKNSNIVIKKNENGVKNSNKEERMVKDVFGLSTQENWKSQGYTITKKCKTDDKLERLKSPLLFKPIKTKDSTKIYFKFHEIDPYFFDKEFTIDNGRKNFKIKTISEFDFSVFFNWVLTLDLNDHIDKYDKSNAGKASSFKTNPKAKNINKIYERIKENRCEVKEND